MHYRPSVELFLIFFEKKKKCFINDLPQGVIYVMNKK